MEPLSAVETFFAGHPLGLEVYLRVSDLLERAGGADVSVSRSQVAFRRRRGFAWLWLPGRWLRRPAADVVLSIALTRHDTSPRWKDVVHPAPHVWMHHLEIRTLGDLDEEVAAWLAEAAAERG